jgi:hypothetical protein
MADQRGHQQGHRAEHQTRQDEGWKHGQISVPGRNDIPEVSDSQKRVGLKNSNGDATDQFRQEQERSRKGRYEQGTHGARFPVVNHRQRRLHGIEEQDHADEAWRDECLVQHVGRVGRNDRDAENLPEAGGKDKQPDQRSDQGGEEPFALVEKAQNFAPDDPAETGQIRAEPVAARRFHIERTNGSFQVHAASAVAVVPVMDLKASRTSDLPVTSSRPGSRPV